MKSPLSGGFSFFYSSSIISFPCLEYLMIGLALLLERSLSFLTKARRMDTLFGYVDALAAF